MALLAGPHHNQRLTVSYYILSVCILFILTLYCCILIRVLCTEQRSGWHRVGPIHLIEDCWLTAEAPTIFVLHHHGTETTGPEGAGAAAPGREGPSTAGAGRGTGRSQYLKWTCRELCNQWMGYISPKRPLCHVQPMVIGIDDWVEEVQASMIFGTR